MSKPAGLARSIEANRIFSRAGGVRSPFESLRTNGKEPQDERKRRLTKDGQQA